MGVLDVARIHMAVLAFLSVGLLVSISMFEKAWNDMHRSRGSAPTSGGRSDKEPEKTDWANALDLDRVRENLPINIIWIELNKNVKAEWYNNTVT